MATRSRKALFIQYRNTYSKNAINSTTLSLPMGSESYDAGNGVDYEMVGLIKKNNNNPYGNPEFSDSKQEIIPMMELNNLPPSW